MAGKLKITSVRSWNELIAAVRKCRTELRKEEKEELWFRGVEHRSHRLLPSLLRCVKKEADRTPERIREIEVNLFFEFLAKARTVGSDVDHWDVLFLMQHYRVPTRLLDWTEVLTVALHFCVAYHECDPHDCPRLYVMNPYRWNQKQTGFGRELVWPRYFGYDEDEDYFYEFGELLSENLIDWDEPVALYPPQRDSRLSAQRGYFTIHGNDMRPVDEIGPELLRAIDLEPSAVADIRDQLELCGVNEYSLFPDLEGLARQLKHRYKLP